MTTHNPSSPSHSVRVTRGTLLVLAGVALGSSVATLNAFVHTAPAPAAVATVISQLPAGIPACATEDSRDCYWLASEFGNGSGRSFVDIAGETIYLEGLDK